MAAIDGFVRALARREEGQPTPLNLRYGIVDTVNATTLDLTLAGGTVAAVAVLADVTAGPGDRVAVLADGTNLLVIGVVST